MTTIVTIILSVLASWGWSEATTDNEPICQVEEVHNGQTVLVPKKCNKVFKTEK